MPPACEEERTGDEGPIEVGVRVQDVHESGAHDPLPRGWAHQRPIGVEFPPVAESAVRQAEHEEPARAIERSLQPAGDLAENKQRYSDDRAVADEGSERRRQGPPPSVAEGAGDEVGLKRAGLDGGRKAVACAKNEIDRERMSRHIAFIP